LELENRKINEILAKQVEGEDGTGSLRQFIFKLVATADLSRGTSFAKEFSARLNRWHFLNSGRIEAAQMTGLSLSAAALLPGLSGSH